MKRLITFALVLVMALSMMVMTASAALAAEAACPNDHRENRHFKFTGGISWVEIANCNNYEGMLYREYDGGSQVFGIDYPDFAAGNVPLPTEAGNWWYMDANLKWNRCTGNHGPQPTAQPKTGVMDTLPLWFGVMAVSACAYVLTSKKKVF